MVQVYTATGGGYGDPKKRPKSQVLEDIRDGYVSAARAKAPRASELTFQLIILKQIPID